MRYIALLIMVLLAGTATAQSSVEVNCVWAAPTTGSPVVEYVLQLSVDGGPYADCCTAIVPSALVSLTVGHLYTARVAGKDSRGRMGPWSDPSLPYDADSGVPGKCGVIQINSARSRE